MPAALIIFFLIFKNPLKIENYYFHYTVEKKIGSEGSRSFFKVIGPVVNLISSVLFKDLFIISLLLPFSLLINGSLRPEHLAFSA